MEKKGINKIVEVTTENIEKGKSYTTIKSNNSTVQIVTDWKTKEQDINILNAKT